MMKKLLPPTTYVSAFIKKIADKKTSEVKPPYVSAFIRTIADKKTSAVKTSYVSAFIKTIADKKTSAVKTAYCLLLLNSGCCYTFKGISIDPDVKTFFIQNFETETSNAPPTLALDFTEKLKDKIRLESRLSLKNSDSDVEFTGKVIEYRVIPVAPKPGEVVELNRLEVGVSVLFIHNKNDKKTWPIARTFRHFAEFNNTVDLLSVQEQLLRETIFPQILDDIFNAAFNDW